MVLRESPAGVREREAHPRIGEAFLASLVRLHKIDISEAGAAVGQARRLRRAPVRGWANVLDGRNRGRVRLMRCPVACRQHSTTARPVADSQRLQAGQHHARRPDRVEAVLDWEMATLAIRSPTSA